MNSIRRTSERPQDQIELGLQLCDPSELNAQLAFSTAEAPVNRPQRLVASAASSSGDADAGDSEKNSFCGVAIPAREL